MTHWDEVARFVSDEARALGLDVTAALELVARLQHAKLLRAAAPAGSIEGFAEFYAAYPRRGGRKEAEAAWRRLSPGAKLRAFIMEKLAAQAASHDWTKAGGQYVPLPATWIRGERWNDVIRAAPVVADPSEPSRAWAEVRAAVQRGNKPPRWCHPKTEAALQVLGGFHVLLEMRTADAPFRQRDFEAAYRATASAG